MGLCLGKGKGKAKEVRGFVEEQCAVVCDLWLCLSPCPGVMLLWWIFNASALGNFEERREGEGMRYTERRAS